MKNSAAASSSFRPRRWRRLPLSAEPTDPALQRLQRPVYRSNFRAAPAPAKMASALAEKGVIEHPWFFSPRGRSARRQLSGGRVPVQQAASPLDVFGRIARGDIFYMELLMPEGYNMFDIAEAVAKLGTSPAAFCRRPGSVC